MLRPRLEPHKAVTPAGMRPRAQPQARTRPQFRADLWTFMGNRTLPSTWSDGIGHPRSSGPCAPQPLQPAPWLCQMGSSKSHQKETCSHMLSLQLALPMSPTSLAPAQELSAGRWTVLPWLAVRAEGGHGGGPRPPPAGRRRGRRAHLQLPDRTRKCGAVALAFRNSQRHSTRQVLPPFAGCTGACPGRGAARSGPYLQQAAGHHPRAR